MSNKKSIVNSLMAGALLAGSMVPYNVLADEVDTSRYQLNIENLRSDNNETKVDGAVYKTDMIKGIDEEGNETDPEEWSVSRSIKDNKLQFLYQETNNVDGIYSVVQTRRAPGYLLNDEKFQVEFPIMKDGIVSAEQAYTAQPKMELIEGELSITKKLEGGEDGQATFAYAKIKERVAPEDTDESLIWQDVENPEWKTLDAHSDVTTGKLTEGVYKVVETSVASEGYMVDRTPLYFTVTADEEGKAQISKIGRISTSGSISTMSTDGTKGEYVLTNYLAPTPDKKVDNREDISVNFGEEFVYTIPVKIPQGIEDFTEFRIVDNVDKKLDIIEDSVQLHKGDIKVNDNGSIDDGTKENIKVEDNLIDADILTLAQTYAKEEGNDGYITLSFKAKIKADAAEDYHEELKVDNKATLEFNNGHGTVTEGAEDNDPHDPKDPEDPDNPDPENPWEPQEPGEEDPNKPPTDTPPITPPETPTVSVRAKAGKFEFKKIGENHTVVSDGQTAEYKDEEKLAGATFALFASKDDAKTNDEEKALENLKGDKLVATSGDDGKVYFDNLGFKDIEKLEEHEGSKEKTYYLKEIKAPEGYRLNNKIYPVKVSAEITGEDENRKLELTVDTSSIGKDSENLVIKNHVNKTSLPVTGVMTMLGGAAIVGGIAFVVLKDKKEEDEK